MIVLHNATHPAAPYPTRYKGPRRTHVDACRLIVSRRFLGCGFRVEHGPWTTRDQMYPSRVLVSIFFGAPHVRQSRGHTGPCGTTLMQASALSQARPTISVAPHGPATRRRPSLGVAETSLIRQLVLARTRTTRRRLMLGVVETALIHQSVLARIPACAHPVRAVIRQAKGEYGSLVHQSSLYGLTTRTPTCMCSPRCRRTGCPKPVTTRSSQPGQ